MRPALVSLSLRIYCLFLPLYPSDFRSSFGSEMLWIFEHQLTDAWLSAGARGFARVWWLTCRDLACVALLSHLRNERLLAFAISAPATTLIFGFLIIALQNRALAMWISHNILFGCR
jgi:hypothetical protein